MPDKPEEAARCEACGAPLYDGDEWLMDDYGVIICYPAIEREGPCYAHRVGSPPTNQQKDEPDADS